MIALETPLDQISASGFGALGPADWEVTTAGGATASVVSGALRLAAPEEGEATPVVVAHAVPVLEARMLAAFSAESLPVFDGAAGGLSSMILFEAAEVFLLENVVDVGLTLIYESWRDGSMIASEGVAAGSLPIALSLETIGGGMRLSAMSPAGAVLLEKTVADFPAVAVRPVFTFIPISGSAGSIDVSDFSISGPMRIEAVSDLVHGCHVKSTIRLYGKGFTSGLSAWVYSLSDLSDVSDPVGAEVISESELKIVLPLFDSPKRRLLILGYEEETSAFDAPLALTWSDKGYRILRSLLAPGRYSGDPADPFNVRLAAKGAGYDRIDAAAHSLYEIEIFPGLALQLLSTWERILGIPTNLSDTAADRRARCAARAAADPRMTTAYLNGLIGAVMAGVTLSSFTDYDLYDVRIFDGRAYEPAPGTLSGATWSELEDLLNQAGPGWSEILVGYPEVIADDAVFDRDFFG